MNYLSRRGVEWSVRAGMPTAIEQELGPSGPAGPHKEILEPRKVQITGKSTHIISLPKRWVDRVRLRGGDTVFLVSRADGTLVVNPTAGLPGAGTFDLEIDITDVSLADVGPRLTAAYRAGWQAMTIVRRPDLSQPFREVMRSLCHSFVGLQVIEETHTSMRLEVLVQAADVALAPRLRRLRSIVHELLYRSMAAGPDAPAPSAADDGYTDAMKLSLWIIRQSRIALRDVFRGARAGLEPAEAIAYERLARVASNMARLALALGRERTHAKPNALEAEQRALIVLFDRAMRGLELRRFDGLEVLSREAEELAHRLAANPGPAPAVAHLLQKGLDLVREATESALETSLVGHPTAAGAQT